MRFNIAKSAHCLWQTELRAIFLAGMLASACVPIEAPPALDSSGDPIELPGAADRWLEIVEVSPAPGEIALRPTFAFTFNDYLDEDSFKSYGFATLTAGGIRASGRAFYRMSDKTVVWRPNAELVSGLNYRVQLTASLKSATGAPFLQPASAPRVFIPTAGPLPDVDPAASAPLPAATWAQVEAIIDASCAHCHADPQWQLNPLSYDSLFGASSEQVDLFLIQPGNPAGSYLMRKILWDYPDIKFTPQPPPWSAGARQLSREELLTIEGWIAHGAQP